MAELRETFIDELKDLYDAEKQLIKALPKMADAAQDGSLKEAFQAHLEETREHVQRLEQVFEHFGEKPRAKKCKAMLGLIEEGDDLIDEEAGDAALICAAQKVEHYEIASYGSLVAWAKLLEESEAQEVLEKTLGEEESADEKLTEIALTAVNPESASEDSEEEEEDEEEDEKKEERVPAQK